MKKISIVIPVYYNADSLPVLFTRLLSIEKQLLHNQMTMELIFVDDGSGDHSLAELIKIKEQRQDVRLIKLTRNFGAVHASKTGFRYVTGDCFMILAADLQDPPELILQMVDHWLEGAKFVICTRNSRQDPILSKLFAHIYYKLLRFFVDKNYPKGGFDLALMDKTMQPYLVNSSKNIYTPLYAYWLGFKPIIIKYDRAKRMHGKSRWTFTKKLSAFLDALLGFSIFPIRFISMIGLLLSVASFVYGSVIVINALLGQAVLPGFATIVTLVSFLLGLVIVMLGIIGEYLWRTFDEVNSRPESVIDEIH